MPAISSKTAVIALHPELPREVDQLSIAQEWGLREAKNGGENAGQLDIWFDDFRSSASVARLNAPRQRAIVSSLDRSKPRLPSEVFFTNPLCLGFSKEQAREALQVIHGAGALVYVSDMGREFGPGDDLEAFWAEHERQLKNTLAAQ